MANFVCGDQEYSLYSVTPLFSASYSAYLKQIYGKEDDVTLDHLPRIGSHIISPALILFFD